MKKIYFFLSNPFFQIYDYSCKIPDQAGFVKDSAQIFSLGLIEIKFLQKEFPLCYKGVLGLSSKSYFSSLLPANLQSYTIFQNPSEFKKYTLKFGDGNASSKDYNYFDSLKGFNWALQTEKTKFNQFILESYIIKLNSDAKSIQLPSKLYTFVVRELVSSF